MRIIKFLSTTAFLLLLFLGAGFLVFREFMLFSASSQIKGALKSLRQIERDPKPYYYKCREKGGDENEAVPEVFQLRFLDNKNYQLEVICRQFPLDPIVVDGRSLPYLVSKVKGSSGLIWGNNKSSLGLEILGRKTLVMVENEQINTGAFKVDFGKTPISNCQGYGFTCCQEETAIGVGSQLLENLDCPRSCFENCQSRPVILSFASDPFYDTKTKTAALKKGEEISFSYVITTSGKSLKSAKISFGDGQEYDFVANTGRISHTYLCNQSVCQFEASIVATDNKGAVSASTGVSKINIMIK